MKAANQKAANQIRAIAKAWHENDPEAMERVKAQINQQTGDDDEPLRLVSLEYDQEAR